MRGSWSRCEGFVESRGGLRLRNIRYIVAGSPQFGRQVCLTDICLYHDRKIFERVEQSEDETIGGGDNVSRRRRKCHVGRV